MSYRADLAAFMTANPSSAWKNSPVSFSLAKYEGVWWFVLFGGLGFLGAWGFFGCFFFCLFVWGILFGGFFGFLDFGFGFWWGFLVVFGFIFPFCRTMNTSTSGLQQFEFSQIFLHSLLHSWGTMGALNVLGVKIKRNFWAQ